MGYPCNHHQSGQSLSIPGKLDANAKKYLLLFFQLQQAMAQLQQIHKKHMEHQLRQSHQQHHHHHNSNNNNNNNSLGGNSNNNNNGGHKERSNTLSQLLEKNRGPQQTKAALTMPTSFQRVERNVGGPSMSASLTSPFGGMSPHMPHLPVNIFVVKMALLRVFFRWGPK